MDPVRTSLSPQVVREINDSLLNRYKLTTLIEKMPAEELKLVHDYLWTEAIKKGPQLVGKVIDHDYIIKLLPPLDQFQKMNKCPEPISRCFQNVCIKTSPSCATLKLKSNIAALAGIFERRKARNSDRTKSLANYLKYFLERHNLIETALVDQTNRVIARFSDIERSANRMSLTMGAAMLKLEPFKSDKTGKSLDLIFFQKIVSPEMKLIYSKLSSNTLIIDEEKVVSDLMRIWNDPKLISTLSQR